MKQYTFECTNYFGFKGCLVVEAENPEEAYKKVQDECEYPCKYIRLCGLLGNGKKSESYSRYSYSGPVMSFDRCIQHNWSAVTMAPSEGRARSNLMYRFKKEAGLLPTALISLPNELEKIG